LANYNRYGTSNDHSSFKWQLAAKTVLEGWFIAQREDAAPLVAMSVTLMALPIAAAVP
jgi:hypothetical protein